MTVRKWRAVGKGLAVSAAVTFLFFSIAKALVYPIAGKNAENYRNEFGLEPPVGDFFISHANFYVSEMPVAWMLILGLYWTPVALFGKGEALHSKASIAMLGIALSLNFYFVINVIFSWFEWSCYYEEHTHEGLIIDRMLECPSRDYLYFTIICASLVLPVGGGILAVFHSRRTLRVNE